MSISLCPFDFLDFFGDFASSAWPTLRRNAFITKSNGGIGPGLLFAPATSTGAASESKSAVMFGKAPTTERQSLR
jgi:hypothetical protein